MLYRRFRIFYDANKFWFWMVLVTGILLVLSVIGLMSMDSFFAQQQIAMAPINLLQMMIWSVAGAVFFAKIMYGGGLFSGTKNTRVKAEDIKVSFKDVIGLTSAKREAMEVVGLIKDRAKIRKIGGKVVRGLLMMGPPGCGKTYLAKAIAHEAGVPFLSMSGSGFVEVFVGVGASRVRTLFQTAKNLSYVHGAAIVFIDEIDALGRQRKFSAFGSQESDTTLNQLLVAMDGLDQDGKGGNVIVIGATNAPEDTLDPALLRPGRFDRILQVSHPRLADREELFRYYLARVKSESSLDVGRLARRTVGKSPADIENIVKEAALISLRDGRETLQYRDISSAIERVDLGLETYLELNTRELERVAVHETGHLVSLYYEHPTDDVFKASIKTRGGALGVVYHNPREELYMRTREEIYANIKVAVAGHVAEKIRYGTVSAGACSDFTNAMHNATAMVWQYGMGTEDFVGDYTLLQKMGALSDDMKDRLNLETQKILKQAMADVEALLRRHGEMFNVFVQELIDKKELDFDQIEAIFKQHGKERAI